jgi:membrane-bound ClpP family serine protease
VPLILGLLPLAAARATEAIHAVLAPIILATSLVAFVPGYLRHRSFLPGILGGIGCLLLLRGLSAQSEAREALLTFAASGLLVVAHARNRALWLRSCAH